MPSFLTLDVIILSIVFLVFFGTSLKFGKSILANFILSFYPTVLIFSSITQLEESSELAKIGAFIAVYAGAYYICGKVSSAYFSYVTHHKYLQATLLSAVCTSLVLYIYYFILPLNTYHNFGSQIDTFFNDKVPAIGWLVIPLIAITISNKE